MKALLQRVTAAKVEVAGSVVGEIGGGLLVLLGVEKGDDIAQAEQLASKTAKYRIFSDADGKMNFNVQQVEGSILVVSQFTLVAETRKGNRPSFTSAGAPDISKALYLAFIDQLRSFKLTVATGEFGADMKVSLTNDGPVTFMLES